MSDYWKRRRSLQRNLIEAEQEINSQLLKMKDAKPEQVSLLSLALGNFHSKKKHFEIELEILEADRLKRAGEKWGLQGTAQQEVYDYTRTGLEQRTYFKGKNKEIMRQLVADARRARIKEWVEIFSPIITVVLSIVALLISALALYLQFTSDTVVVMPAPPTL